MSIFNELLPKICEISNAYTKNFNDDLKDAFQCVDKFEEESLNCKNRARDKVQKDKNAVSILQSINEDDDEAKKSPQTISDSSSITSNNDRTSNDSTDCRGTKKRSKHEVDGMESPEQDKRQKRNASVKAQSIISKQVNVNLTQKLRRDNSLEKSSKNNRRGKEDDKENYEPVPIVQIKQEKISLPEPEPMDLESIPIDPSIVLKQENDKDGTIMPPPVAPVPKTRKAVTKEKLEEVSDEENTGRRRTTRTRKQTDTLAASNRSTRASSRSAKQIESEDTQADAIPRRSRAKKGAETKAAIEKDNQAPVENGSASPAEKPRPKRTRRNLKAVEKEPEKPEEVQKQPDIISLKEETIHSPILTMTKKHNNTKLKQDDKSYINKEIQLTIKDNIEINVTNDKEEIGVTERDVTDNTDMDKTKLINKPMNSTMVISKDLDKTVVLPNGVYNHAPVTPKSVCQVNETVVLEACNQTFVLEKAKTNVMDATVVLDKNPKQNNLTEDNSLLTDDSDTIEHTPPKNPPIQQPTSAVKEKVQQFEEMATRITRTKTRAMAKKDEETEQTPPDKISKAVLSSDTLTKMNSMIFNGKTPQISVSATKPRANTSNKSHIPTSMSKLSGINKAREAEEQRREIEDARRKKEALLEAKRELQKKKREEKMAAAAAARSAAERERRALLQAAARERLEKQAHADLGKLERLREAERKKLEQARKVAETEERRRADEHARQLRLAEEQKRAEARKKQLEEAEAMKKEAVIKEKEIERMKKEYMERQKMKQRMEGDRMQTPLRGAATLEPVYMAGGFEFLNSDSDDEQPEPVPPAWSNSKGRLPQMRIQVCIAVALVDRLFSVRAHTPDLREIFPNIERARLKRTSSAVWRTPPRALPPVRE